MRAVTVAIAVLIWTTAGCASSRAPEGERETLSPFRPAELRLRIEAAGTDNEAEPPPKLARTVQSDLPTEGPAPRSDTDAEEGPWVQLRGSNEVHVSTCEKVRSAPGEAAPATRDAGDPCPLCRMGEAVAADR